MCLGCRKAALDRLDREPGKADPVITSTIELADHQGRPLRVTFSGTDPSGVAEAVNTFLRSRNHD